MKIVRIIGQIPYFFFDALRNWIQLIVGRYKIAKLNGPIITIFAGRGVDHDGALQDGYYEQARKIAQLCSSRGFSVLTGGGPGLMEAASCGAFDYCSDHKLGYAGTLGIGVTGIDTHFTSPCAPIFYVRHFFMRKSLLIDQSSGFIVLPGGIGTVDELFELLNLIKLNRRAKVPIILININYWQPLANWYYACGVAEGFIKPSCKDLFVLTDDIEYAVSLIEQYTKSNKITD